MVEREALERRDGATSPRAEERPATGLRRATASIGRAEPMQGTITVARLTGAPAAISATRGQHVVRLPAVEVAVAGEQHAAARSGRSDREPPARRSPASTTTTRRRSLPRRAPRRSSRACSACRRRRDRPAECPPLAAPTAHAARLRIQIRSAERRARGLPFAVEDDRRRASRGVRRFSAKLSRASGKNRAPGMLVEVVDDAAAHLATNAGENPRRLARSRSGRSMEKR